ncbi:MAG: NUDIX hydrolase [Candidatus Gastranaerophilales bacterium]|nr:NUDIX hydrolase [Candidatus Gastranaerophilales bacterium]
MEEFKEKQTNRKEIYNGRVIDVVCDDVILQDGKASKREVVLHSGGVVILAVDKNNMVYMVKQYRYAVQKEIYELPAGRLEKGEDPFECAKRELEEECGLVADTWESLGFIYSSPGILSEKLYLYKATNLKQTQQHLDEGEFLSVSKFNIDNVLGMIKENRINDAKTICAVSLGKLF